MKYAIVYISQTGNTALLAEQVLATLPEGACIHYGAPAPKAAEAELLFIGFWTDKGTCGEELATFLNTLSERRVFLFGTAGFGGAEAYFKQIIARVSAHLEKSNTVVDTYMCQGKMPLTVRARFEAMADAEQARPMLANFDHARTHPDTADLARLGKVIAALIEDHNCLSHIDTCNHG